MLSESVYQNQAFDSPEKLRNSSMDKSALKNKRRNVFENREAKGLRILTSKKKFISVDN